MEGNDAKKRKRDGADASAATDDVVARMRRENTRLRNRCHDLKGTVRLLKENLTWEYAAPEPKDPMAYWESRGYSFEGAEWQTKQAQRFYDQMKWCVRQLRRGKVPSPPLWVQEFADEDLPFGYKDGTIYLRSRGLYHDDILLPHWKELARALQFYHRVFGGGVKLLHVCIIGIQLSKEALDVLGEGLNGFRNIRTLMFLKNSNFITVNDGGNPGNGPHICPSDIVSFAIDVIRSNPRLERFSFSRNKIEDMSIIHSLINIARDHHALHRLDLKGCCGEGVDSFAMLQSLIEAGGDRLRRIDFSKNGVETKGSTFLSDLLAGNPPLEHLDIHGNRLDDNDARLIANALRSNTNLRQLGIDRNVGITVAGRKMLRDALFDSSTLNAASDSNHTCQIDSELIFNQSDEAAINRGDKIFLILSYRNREQPNENVRDLESDKVTLKEIPQVLKCVQTYSQHARRHAKCLSVLYEIMRGWEMPSLYERRRFPSNTTSENVGAR